MPMKAVALANRLLLMGFSHGDPKDLSDRPIQKCIYLTRVHRGQHQYVSLCSYSDTFVEAVIEIYPTAKNTRSKTPQTNLASPAIARSFEAIIGAIDGGSLSSL